MIHPQQATSGSHSAPQPPVLVAIDGPAGSGKSSVSRAAAARLGYGILDTGAAYRALAWAALRRDIDLADQAALLQVLNNWHYATNLVGQPRCAVRLPDPQSLEKLPAQDITQEIRTPTISAHVSSVSRHPAVRQQLNRMFRALVAHSGLPGVVIEGRDITTVVAPNAPVRILLTANSDVRASRRAAELPVAAREQVLAQLLARDAQDAEVVDFFKPASGVTLIDTSDLDFEQAVQAVVNVVAACTSAAEKSEK